MSETAPPSAGSRSQPILRVRGESRVEAEDALVVEEPLEIHVSGRPVVVVMRTPGRDDELAAGFLFTEGLLESPADLGAIHACRGANGAPLPNVVNVLPAEGRTLDIERFRRDFPSGSSCGICGKASIDQVRRRLPPVEDPVRIPLATLLGLPGRMRAIQPLFQLTGAIHAAALFDAAGTLLLAREDIGRHNAVDRVVGRMVMEERLPLTGHLLAVSGRISFEIVQKALAARIPIVAAVSGASTLAVELAEAGGLTLAGFVRGDGCNVYCGRERVT